MKPLNSKLYLVTRPFSQEEGGFTELHRRVELALESGAVGMVQLREESDPDGGLVSRAVCLRELCHAYGAKFVVNNHLAVAEAAGADGVHLGQQDATVAEARAALGERAIIGVSVRTGPEAIRAAIAGAAYLAANGVYPSRSKRDFGEPIGPSGVAHLRAATILPLFAIGGITVDNALFVALHGADGVAVISSILEAADIPRACRDLCGKVASGINLRRPQRGRRAQ